MPQQIKSIEDFRKHYPRTTFRLGITMAGAVSAGAYSAGVMCYLLQTLEAWESKKSENYHKLFDKAQAINGAKGVPFTAEWLVDNKEQIEKEADYDGRIPMHDVVIEVIGGASAGSLVAAIAVLSMAFEQQKIDAYQIQEKETKQEKATQQKATQQEATQEEDLALDKNLLYDSWVNLSNNISGPVDAFKRLLAVNREKELGQPFALLNPELLEDVKHYQLKRLFGADKREEKINWQYKERQSMPMFVSPDLHVYFSFASLRGIPIGIAFSKNKQDASDKDKSPLPAHRMRMHAGMTIFVKGDSRRSEYELNPFRRDLAKLLIDASLASGAFPVGFPPRNIVLSTQYVKSYVEKTLGIEKVGLIDIQLGADIVFDLAAIDGGTLNNEPFTEVYEQLKRRTKSLENEKPALILIDPFPNFEQEDDIPYRSPKSLSDIVFGILGALRGQAMIKDPEKMRNLAALNGQHIGMIFPSRRDSNRNTIKHEPALATSALGGFAGFLSEDFRKHDFHLGMKNCQSFLWRHFHIEADQIPTYPSFMDVNPERDRIFATDKNGSRAAFPIIPDMALLDLGSAASENMDHGIKPLPFPKLENEKILRYRKFIYRRTAFLLLRLMTPKRRASKKASWKPVAVIIRPVLFFLICLAIIVFVIWQLFSILKSLYFCGLVICLIVFVFMSWCTVVSVITAKVMRAIGEELVTGNQLQEKS